MLRFTPSGPFSRSGGGSCGWRVLHSETWGRYRCSVGSSERIRVPDSFVNHFSKNPATAGFRRPLFRCGLLSKTHYSGSGYVAERAWWDARTLRLQVMPPLIPADGQPLYKSRSSPEWVCDRTAANTTGTLHHSRMTQPFWCGTTPVWKPERGANFGLPDHSPARASPEPNGGQGPFFAYKARPNLTWSKPARRHK